MRLGGLHAAALLTLSGCDMLFQLDDVKASTVDAASDTGCGMPDEDGDCIADDVDNCPGIKNPSQASDGDSDSVGDVCDPRPTVAGDMRVSFFGFNDDADRAAWPAQDENWVFMPGSYDHAAVADNYGFLESVTTAGDADLTIEAGFTFTAWDTSQPVSRLGVWLDMPDLPALDGQNCYITLYGASSSEDTLYQQEAVYQAGGGGSSHAIAISALKAGDEIVFSLRQHRNPDLLQCHVLINGQRTDVTDVTRSGTTTWAAAGHLGVQAGSASARLRYVVTYVGQ